MNRQRFGRPLVGTSCQVSSTGLLACRLTAGIRTQEAGDRIVTPSATQQFLKSPAGEDWSDHVLWRAPGGREYILSPPGADARYWEEGWQRFDTVAQLRRLILRPFRKGPLLLILRTDIERERGSTQGGLDSRGRR